MGEGLYPDMSQSLLAVETEGLETAVAEHLQHLGVFLTLFFECELALFIVVFVLAATPVFAALEGGEKKRCLAGGRYRDAKEWVFFVEVGVGGGAGVRRV